MTEKSQKNFIFKDEDMISTYIIKYKHFKKIILNILFLPFFYKYITLFFKYILRK